MMMKKSVLKYSHIHGLGCFAAEDIKQGEEVWRLDLGIDLVFRERDLEKLPASFIEFLKMYAYSPLSEREKLYILCADHARHMNHSEDPNLLETKDGRNIAARDISSGEELTCNYNEFDKDAKVKLSGSDTSAI